MEDDQPKHGDEFEIYFQKAAAAAQKSNLERLIMEESVIARRGSLPNSVRRIQLEEGVGDHVKRASSFRKTPKTSSSTLLPQGDIHSDRTTSSNIDVRVNFTSGDPPGSSNNLLSPNVSTMNSSSAPQSRSGSFKRLSKPKSVKDFQEMHRDGSQRRVSVNLEEVVASKLEELKQLESDNCCVVRSFVTSPKGLVNRGDSFKRKPSDSTKHSTSGGIGPSTGSTTRKHTRSPLSRVLSHEKPHNVLIMGERSVGKTSLVTQFMTSEYLAGLDTSFGNYTLHK